MADKRIAHVPTKSGSRYLQQLCKHWAHKMPVEFTPEAGQVSFPSGVVARMTAHPGHLEICIDLPDPSAAEQMQDVFVRHLDRFAFREAPLPFIWADA